VNWFCKENEKHELLTDKLANIIGYGSPNQTAGFCFNMDVKKCSYYGQWSSGYYPLL
jgi:hypothetical protein